MHSKIPLKIKVFVWLVLKKKNATIDKLLKRGWMDDSTCVVCGSEEKSVGHLFARCVFCKFPFVSGMDGIQTQDLEIDVNLVEIDGEARRVSIRKETGLSI